MAKFKLVEDPSNPCLYAPCKKIKNVQDPSSIILAQTLLDYAKKTPRCVGLAANQLGQNKQMCVVNYVTDESLGPWVILINPKIVDAGEEKVWGEEGCLSHPGITCQVRRPLAITFLATSIQDGKRYKLEANGYVARIIQHEIDHLNSLMITDKGMDLKEVIIHPVEMQHLMDITAEHLHSGGEYEEPQTD